MTSKAMAPTYLENGGVPTRTSVLEDPQNEVQEAHYPAMLESLEDAAALVDKGISRGRDHPHHRRRPAFS